MQLIHLGIMEAHLNSRIIGITIASSISIPEPEQNHNSYYVSTTFTENNNILMAEINLEFHVRDYKTYIMECFNSQEECCLKLLSTIPNSNCRITIFGTIIEFKETDYIRQFQINFKAPINKISIEDCVYEHQSSGYKGIIKFPLTDRIKHCSKEPVVLKRRIGDA